MTRPRDRYGRPLPPGSPDELRGRREVEQAGGPIEARLALARELFERQLFFEAHELLESIWKSGVSDPRDRGWWKGLTQLAVGLCHAQRGNTAGAVALLERSAGYLACDPALSSVARDLAARIGRYGLPADDSALKRIAIAIRARPLG